jgi:hypothetical protein
VLEFGPDSSLGKTMYFGKVFYERPSQTVDTLELARTLIDLKEFRKAAFIVEPIAAQNQTALFLKNYASFLFIEHKLEEAALDQGDKAGAHTF